MLGGLALGTHQDNQGLVHPGLRLLQLGVVRNCAHDEAGPSGEISGRHVGGYLGLVFAVVVVVVVGGILAASLLLASAGVGLSIWANAWRTRPGRSVFQSAREV